MEHSARPEPKNLVICCDGTGNEISENISNVLKLYRCLRKTDRTQPRQMVFYDPGVGTVTEPSTWHQIKANVNLVLGLATGYGLDDNVLSAYCFLVEHYTHGDKIYLFGFSRGAYTVRVLAGLIHKIGLISPEQVNLAGSGLVAYKQYSGTGRGNDVSDVQGVSVDDQGPLPQGTFDLAAQFARITSTRWPTIHFVGVWDTVASVIVPRRDNFFYLFSLEELAFTLRNPSVKIFRQAIAIDERRCMFRLKKYEEPQEFWSNRYVPDEKKVPQDILQVWFAGVHSDVGGGYPEVESGESISADLDDRGGGEGGAELQPRDGEAARLGHPAQELAVQVCGAGLHRQDGHAARFHDGGLAAAGVSAEAREVPGVADAKSLFRLLHSRLRAARHSRRRACA